MDSKDLSKIPAFPQSQGSTKKQLDTLHWIANRVGLYDAADAIKQLIPRIGDLKYGCHIEPCEGIFHTCVIDEEDFDECIFAKPGMRKEQCEHWRIIK